MSVVSSLLGYHYRIRATSLFSNLLLFLIFFARPCCIRIRSLALRSWRCCLSPRHLLRRWGQSRSPAVPEAASSASSSVDSSAASSSGTAATPEAAGTLEAALPKTYDPAGTEARWQAAWEEAGAFHPDPHDSDPSNPSYRPPFSVVIPPPNVTGSLHMGHAFNTALIDTIVRFQRLQGKNVLLSLIHISEPTRLRRSRMPSSA